MALPRFNDMYLPILTLLHKCGELKTQSISLELKRYYNLSDEEYVEVSPKGNSIFYGRVSWALSDLYRAGLLEKPRQAIYKLSVLGKNMLQSSEEIETFILQTVRSLQKRKYKSSPSIASSEQQKETSPLELLEQAYQEIKENVIQDILSTILQKKPSEFERLTLQLLKAMGYGGALKNAHTQTKLSNDGGIDGIIKEDVLGLGHIYLQVKRYSKENNVSRGEIQQFVGAISTAQSNKGIFITTSDFSPRAYDYASKLTDKSIVLINGSLLAEYIYEYGLGMQQKQVFEIKALDYDNFWNTYLDEERP